ncbi:MAG: hypothetical protein QM758_22525 [Armatimonas sp.]
MNSVQDRFRQDAGHALERLRSALERIILSLPGAPHRAVALERALTIDRVLAWRITTFVFKTEPSTLSRSLPGTQALQKFLQAAREAGVDDTYIVATEEALAELDEVVRRHCGSRKRFEQMLATLAPADSTDALFETRRVAFEANAALWGASAQVELCVGILGRETSDPEILGFVNYKGYIGLELLRDSASWPIGIAWSSQDDRMTRRPEDEQGIIPLFDLAHPSTEVQGLFVDECVQIEATAMDEGCQRYSVRLPQLGRTAASRCVFANSLRHWGGRAPEENDTEIRLATGETTPSKLLVLDLLVDRTLYGPVFPKAEVVADTTPGQLLSDFALPLAQTIQPLGPASVAPTVPEIPRYAEMLAYGMARMSWNIADFDLYRLRIAYPMLSTVTMVSFPKQH